MIKINYENDREKADRFSHRFEVGDDYTKWCGALPDEESPERLEYGCSRRRFHTGPHRRFSNPYLHLWYDSGHEEEERVLEMCVQLDTPPGNEDDKT